MRKLRVLMVCLMVAVMVALAVAPAASAASGLCGTSVYSNIDGGPYYRLPGATVRFYSQKEGYIARCVTDGNGWCGIYHSADDGDRVKFITSAPGKPTSYSSWSCYVYGTFSMVGRTNYYGNSQFGTWGAGSWWAQCQP